MIKNIVFDMGNVLMAFSPESILSHFTHDISLIETLKKRIFYSEIWGSLDNGDVSFDDTCLEVIQNNPDLDAALLKDIFKTWHRYKIEDKAMTQLVQKLKKMGYGIYLLSNAAPSFYTYKDHFEVIQCFDGILLSSDINISKPDARIYNELLHRFNLNADDCLFIDDSIANIKAASNLGFHTYHYSGYIDLLIEYLEAVDIIH